MKEKVFPMKPRIPKDFDTKGDPKAEGYTDWDLSRISGMIWNGGVHKKCGTLLATGGYGFHYYCWNCHKIIDRNEEVNSLDEKAWKNYLIERETLVGLDYT